MTQPQWSGDDALMADLRDALASAEPTTEASLQAGRAAFTWRTVDEELAALTFDSLLEDRAVLRSGSAAPRSLVFESGDLSVEIDVVARRIVGQLLPAGPGEVVVQSPTAEVARVAVDDAGCFTVDVGGPASEVVRLRCTTGTATVVTDWVRL